MSYEDWYPRNYPATLSNFLSSNIVIIFFIPKTPPLPPPLPPITLKKPIADDLFWQDN